MDAFFIAITVFLLESAGSEYIRSRDAGTWNIARDNCEEFGGHLAVLDNLDAFLKEVRSMPLTLGIGEELWIGASLEQSLWEWRGQSTTRFNADGRYYSRRGCLQHEPGLAGTKVAALTPEKCSQICNWEGVIGLQNDTCLCNKDLTNISSNEPGVCHIPCRSPSTAMCGGYSAVSLYKQGRRSILWADQEPIPQYDCAFLRRRSKHEELQFVSADCNMHSRYLCKFQDDDKCGLSTECFRWSSLPATWDDAVAGCLAMNGSLAVLEDSLVSELRSDLDRLPVGGFWLALRRNRNWRWLNGQTMRMSALVSASQTCAVVTRTTGNAVDITAEKCDMQKYYLCQYDYMRKRPRSDMIPAADSIRSDGTLEYDDNLTTVGESGIGDATDVTASTETSDKNGELVFTSVSGMYMVLGFVSGMVCVLILGLIVYLICRCRQPSGDKHTRLVDHSSSHQDVHSVNYSAKNESVRISPPHSDIMYDTVYDLNAESPFRRTQRLIRMGSANSWRNTQSRRTTNDVFDSPGTSYAWRGVIGGDVEIINTELRQQNLHQSDLNTSFDNRFAPLGQAPGVSVRRLGGSPDFDRIDVLYELPERSDSFDYERGRNRIENSGQSAHMQGDPSFLDFCTARNSTDLNDENIYATIKKTFQKMKEDMA